MGARIRPPRNTLAALLGLVQALTVGIVRDFVWADLRTGLIRVGDLPRATRALVWSGFVLLFGLVGLLLFNDLWRASFDLLAASAGTPGRGSLTPVALIPATFYLLTVSWSFVLSGALHIRTLLRLAILGSYLIVSSIWIRSSLVTTQSMGDRLVAWGPLVGIVLWFLVRWRRSPRPVLEFVVIFVLVAASYGTIQQRLVATWRYSDTPLFLNILDSNIVAYAGLVLPLLLLIGLDVADFVYRASSWAVSIVATHLSRLGILVGLAVAAAGWLWWLLHIWRAQLAAAPASAVVGAYLSAAVIPLSALLVWWLVDRRGGRAGRLAMTAQEVSDAAHGSAPWFIVAFLSSNLALIVVSSLLVALGSALDQVTGMLVSVDALVAAHQRNLLLYGVVLALLVAAWAWWRRRRALALYLGVLGTTLLWGDLTGPGRPLARYAWEGPEVAVWWVILFLGTGLVWLLQGKLTAARGARLLLLLCMASLLRQTDFIGQPLGPLFSFSGVGLIAFGLVWDALTIGSWANDSTPRLPRISRVLLYLGYVLFTATIVNWVLTAHNLSYVETLTGDAAISGLKLVGRPMLYALSIVILTQPDQPPINQSTNQPVA